MSNSRFLFLPVLHVAVFFEPPARHFVRRRGHIVDACRVDPAVVEIKQRAHIDSVIDRFIGPARALHRVYVFLSDLIRRAIDFIYELKQSFLFV